jgi:hypothetical protein
MATSLRFFLTLVGKHNMTEKSSMKNALFKENGTTFEKVYILNPPPREEC